jgi:hypothetical protein
LSPSRSSCPKDVEASLRGGGKHPGHRRHHARPRPKAVDKTRGSRPALRTRVRKRPASVGARLPKTKVGACREAGGDKVHRRVVQPPRGRQCEGPTPLLLNALAGGVRSREGQSPRKTEILSLSWLGDTQCGPNVATTDDVEPSVRANSSCVILRNVANVWNIRRIANCNVLNAASRATWE